MTFPSLLRQSKLKPRDDRAISLHLQGMSFVEIGKELGLPARQARRIVLRVLRVRRQLLAEFFAADNKVA